MKERSYTVAEIDRMRSIIEYDWMFGDKISEREPNTIEISRGYTTEEKTKCVEELLRTYMLAGIDPKELE